MSDEFLEYLVSQGENEWIEFKETKDSQLEIGCYISALANSAVLQGVPRAYLIFGVTDKCKIVGTKFNIKDEKIGNENLEHWLHNCLKQDADFSIQTMKYKGKKDIVIFEISPAINIPVRFKGEAFIRIGSSKQPLKSCLYKERELWRALADLCFECAVAKPIATFKELSSLLDIKAFFKLLGLPKPEDKKDILSNLIEYGLITTQNNALNITNLGAILFAKKLNDFRTLVNRQVRIIKYKDNNNLKTASEKVINSGYAVGFDSLLNSIATLLGNKKSLYPKVAIKEIVANALIHQDFAINGSPMIEIYDNRIEVTNSGKSLIEATRLVNYPPKSRNEKLARLMRLMGLCEGKGVGVDRIIDSAESMAIAIPRFEVENDYFKATLFAPQAFDKIDINDKIRATYQHTCLRYAKGDYMTDLSLAKRFRLDKGQNIEIIKLINNTLETKLIKSNKSKPTKYLPYFA